MRSLACAAVIIAAGALAGVFAVGGSASTATPGDGCLVVEQGYGKVTIMLTRGVILGRFQSGTISYTDQDGDTTPNLPRVPGVPFTKTGEHTWTYGTADNVRFRASGPTKLTINATYMSLSAAGKGWTRLSVAGFIQDIAGKFSVDDESFCEAGFQKMPLVPTKFQISSPVAG